MLACVSSAILRGVDGHAVRVEVHVSNGLPAFSVVGLPDASCREARDRVRAALLSSGERWPQHRITVNLAPSGLPKGGSGLDLAIAVGVLVAAGALPAESVADVGLLGELGLDGSVRAVPGLLPMVDAIAEGTVVVPGAGAVEASVLGRHQVRAVSSLAELVAALRGRVPWAEHPPEPDRATEDEGPAQPDLADVRGQPLARRAVEVAAAGGHHLLMVGPPGAGKSMLAARLPGLLPDLDAEVAMAATRVHSAAGDRLPARGLLVRPPFRAPHHGASMAALIGGGSAWLRPGEVSLAHGGVLFLDELAEFPPSVLDALRQPLEEGRVRVARAHGSVVFPARFLLVAATNPCPCGYAGTPQPCRCPDHVRRRYGRRLSGPLLDRFDLRIHVERAGPTQLAAASSAEETSAEVAVRVRRARALARARGVGANGQLDGAALDRYAALRTDSRKMLHDALAAGRITARGFQRIRRVARTLADLAGDEAATLDTEHVAVAMHLRAEIAALVGQEAA